MQLLIDIVSWALILAGSFFYLVGAIGMARMPDVFTRMHATSVSETLGVGGLITGMMLQAGWTLNAGRLAIIFAILLYTGPIATHALARAALAAGVVPRLSQDRTRRQPAAAADVAGEPEKPAAKRPAGKKAVSVRTKPGTKPAAATAKSRTGKRGKKPSKP